MLNIYTYLDTIRKCYQTISFFSCKKGLNFLNQSISFKRSQAEDKYCTIGMRISQSSLQMFMIRNIQSCQDYPRSSGITLSAKQSDISTAKSIITDRKITGINPSQSKCHIPMCVLCLAHTRGSAAARGLFNLQGHRERIYFLSCAKIG